jgi:uncharacterized membrane protein (UPF0127 family)
MLQANNPDTFIYLFFLKKKNNSNIWMEDTAMELEIF